MEATVEQRREIKFVGIRLVARFEELSDLVPEAREQLLLRMREIPSVVNPRVQLGVTHPDEPAPSDEEVATNLGFEVREYGQVPTGMRALTIPAGRYARFEWRGSFLAPEFETFYPSLFEWMKSHSLAPSPDKPWVEVYDEDTHNWEDKADPANRLTVLIPLAEAR